MAAMTRCRFRMTHTWPRSARPTQADHGCDATADVLTHFVSRPVGEVRRAPTRTVRTVTLAEPRAARATGLPAPGLRDRMAAPVAAAFRRALRAPPAPPPDLGVRPGSGIRARDGVILRTDHYAPPLDDAPTVLVRTPYGRRGLTAVAARMLASLGFHVLVSSCRGTADSGGAFDPLRNERADGL